MPSKFLPKEAHDTLTVTNAIQDRHGRRLVDHEQWLEEITHAQAMHQQWLQRHEASMERLERNLEVIAELILRGHSGNGSVKAQ